MPIYYQFPLPSGNFLEASSFLQIYRAIKECARGVRWKDSVQNWLLIPAVKASKLSDEVRKGKYKIQKYDKFEVFEPKRRTIYSVKFKDRVWQRAMCNNGLYEEMTHGFIDDSCACLKFRGIDYAVERMRYHMTGWYHKNKNDGYFVKLDIRKFFDSVPRSVSLETVKKYVKTPEYVYFLNEIVNNFDCVNNFDDGFGDRGIALGSQISQLLALCVLDPLDHEIKEKLKIKHYIRYMDDMIFIVKTKEEARFILHYVEKWLEKIGLQLNPKSSIFNVSQGVTFLKYHFKFSPTGRIYMNSNRSLVSRERKRLKKLLPRWKSGRLSDDYIFNQISSWMSHVKRARSFGKIIRMKNFASSVYGDWLHERLFPIEIKKANEEANKIYLEGLSAGSTLESNSKR